MVSTQDISSEYSVDIAQVLDDAEMEDEAQKFLECNDEFLDRNEYLNWASKKQMPIEQQAEKDRDMMFLLNREQENFLLGAQMHDMWEYLKSKKIYSKELFKTFMVNRFRRYYGVCQDSGFRYNRKDTPVMDNYQFNAGVQQANASLNMQCDVRPDFLLRHNNVRQKFCQVINRQYVETLNELMRLNWDDNAMRMKDLTLVQMQVLDNIEIRIPISLDITESEEEEE